NLPIVSWFALRGECRSCGAPISARYPLVEALVGFLFLGAYLADVIAAPRGDWGEIPAFQLVAAAYHCVFLALLVAAAFIDYDLMIIPDEIAVTGIVLGIVLGTIWPGVRPEPASASTHLGGFWIGLVGLAIGCGIILLVRQCAEIVLLVLRVLRLTEMKEGMGLGDLTLLGMIGAFMGWQAAILTFFLAPFFGLGQAVWKLINKIKKWMQGRQLTSLDREMPFGPYLSMAAAALLFLWPKLWKGWALGLFDAIYVIFWSMLGVNVDRPI